MSIRNRLTSLLGSLLLAVQPALADGVGGGRDGVVGGIGLSSFGSSSVLLPQQSSLIGLWVGADFTTANGVATIPNRMASTPSNQLIAAPRRQFNANQYYFNTQGTVTDNNDTAPDGTNEATTITTAGSQSWYIQVGNASPVANVLPAGAWTLVSSIKWDGGGGSQNYAHGCAHSAAGLQTDTAPNDSLYHRVPMTFTSDGVTTLFCEGIASPTGGSQANFSIVDMNLYKGSVDLGAATNGAPLAGHMIFGGPSLAQNSVTHDATSVSFAGALGADVQFPATQAFNAFTLCYVTKNSGSPTNASFNPIVSRLNAATWVSFGVGASLNGPWGMQWNNALKTPNQGPGYNIENQANYQDVCITYDPLGTGVANTYVNGRLVISNTSAGISQSIKELWVGMLQKSFFSNYQLAYMSLWTTSLTAAQVKQAHKWALANINVSMPDALWLVYKGDSITIGASITNNFNWAFYTYQGLSKVAHGPNLGIAGLTCAQIQSQEQANATTSIKAAVADGLEVVTQTLCGTNDAIGGINPTTVSAPTAEAMVAADLAAGARKAFVTTMLPGGVSSGTCFSGGVSLCNNFRATLNPLLKAYQLGTPNVGLVDFASESTMGPDSAPSNAALYNADQIHPTGPPTTNTTGAFFLYNADVAAINAGL